MKQELTVTLVVKVLPKTDDHEATAREVMELTLAALDSFGLEPISGGYGFKPTP